MFNMKMGSFHLGGDVAEINDGAGTYEADIHVRQFTTQGLYQNNKNGKQTTTNKQTNKIILVKAGSWLYWRRPVTC